MKKTQNVARALRCTLLASAAVVVECSGAAALPPYMFSVPAPSSAATTYSGVTNPVGTTSTAITINGLALSATNYKTVTLTNTTGCDVWLNLTGGTAAAQSGRVVASNYQITFGAAVGYDMPTNGVTGIAVNAGASTACTGGAVTLAVDAR